MRELIRSVAKARLKAMQVPHANKVFGLGIKRSKLHKLEKTASGRRLLDKLRAKHEPLWRRVVFGSLKQDAERAQFGLNRRKYRPVRTGA